MHTCRVLPWYQIRIKSVYRSIEMQWSHDHELKMITLTKRHRLQSWASCIGASLAFAMQAIVHTCTIIACWARSISPMGPTTPRANGSHSRLCPSVMALCAHLALRWHPPRLCLLFRDHIEIASLALQLTGLCPSSVAHCLCSHKRVYSWLCPSAACFAVVFLLLDYCLGQHLTLCHHPLL